MSPCPSKYALPAEWARGRQEDPFHVERLADELAPNGQERGDRPGHVRCRHAGSAVLHIVGAPFWVAGVARPPSPSCRRLPAPQDVMRSPGATRSGLSRPSPGRPFGREVRHTIRVGRVTMRGSDGDRRLRVPRIVDGVRESDFAWAEAEAATVPNPVFPAAATTTTPDWTRRFTSAQMGLCPQANISARRTRSRH